MQKGKKKSLQFAGVGRDVEKERGREREQERDGGDRKSDE